MTITHADIIPLIGGMVLGSERAFGTRPDYMMSFEPFWGNDRHVVNHYGDVPYHVIDKGERPSHKVDVISSTCPCAGLSQMHSNYGDHNENNKWMPLTAEFVLGEMRPQVYWGENAPGFAGKIGKNVRENLYRIGRENGYSMSMYRTKSLLHGVPQVRERTFYFFWRGDRVPLLDYYSRKHTPIEDVIRSAAASNFQRDPINRRTPSQDPWYRYILEEVHGGRTHAEHCRLVEPQTARGGDALTYIERQGHDYPRVAVWMRANGFERQAASCERMHAKLQAGGNLYRRGVVVPKDYIGAFVAHYPMMLTHPDEDRFIDYREAMTIMDMPLDFELLDASTKNSNMICQNVPVQTAEDMAYEVQQALLGNREWIDSTYVLQRNHSRDHQVWDKKTSTIEEFAA